MSVVYCIKCGKQHAGEYSVCNKCLYEFYISNSNRKPYETQKVDEYPPLGTLSKAASKTPCLNCKYCDSSNLLLSFPGQYSLTCGIRYYVTVGDYSQPEQPCGKYE